MLRWRRTLIVIMSFNLFMYPNSQNDSFNYPFLRLNAECFLPEEEATKSSENSFSVIGGVSMAAICATALNSCYGKALFKALKIPEAYNPLVTVLGSIVGYTVGAHVMERPERRSSMTAMNNFMGAFLMLFGLCKIYNVRQFIHAYSEYDLLAKLSPLYAMSYPFLEVCLGLGYLVDYDPLVINLVTSNLNLLNALSVLKLLLIDKKSVSCPCLGQFMNVPVSKVTLYEDLIMSIMSVSALYCLPPRS
ncbi:MAG TPA: MauE/DoxX family redox-associated membrane protein [Candidatus Babeliaceae bacterium]|nr:MauE/DoxX family redox-associated membrane protein [Candidatus Babeliaceae bacterium]